MARRPGESQILSGDREKIESDPQNPRYLKTAHGVGYRFDYPEIAAPRLAPASCNPTHCVW
jgi:hypothetical protein